MKLGFSLLCLLSLTACHFNLPRQSEDRYLQAKSLPALKVPKRLQKTTYLHPSFEIPKGPVARTKDPRVNPYPKQFVKPLKS